jgi:hypothetical protein
MTEDLKTEIDAAMAPVEGRHKAEQLRLANDATLQRIAARGFQIGKGDILQLHLSILLDQLLGDFDDPRRQAYEIAVHTRMAEVLAETETAINRQALLEGVKMPPVNPAPNGPRPGQRPRRG